MISCVIDSKVGRKSSVWVGLGKKPGTGD